MYAISWQTPLHIHIYRAKRVNIVIIIVILHIIIIIIITAALFRIARIIQSRIYYIIIIVIHS